MIIIIMIITIIVLIIVLLSVASLLVMLVSLSVSPFEYELYHFEVQHYLAALHLDSRRSLTNS